MTTGSVKLPPLESKPKPHSNNPTVQQLAVLPSEPATFVQSSGAPQRTQSQPSKQPVTRYKNTCQLFSHVCTLTLGMFLFGYCLAYHAAIPTLMTMQIFGINMTVSGTMALISAIIPIAAALGSWLCGPITSRLSRRQTMLLVGVIQLIGTGLILIATFPTLIIGRILQGICVGIYTSLVPVFINEISPLELTGTFGTFSSSFIALGIIVTNILAIFVNDWDEDFKVISEIWRLVFGFPLITGTLQIVLLLFVFKDETPRYYLEKGRDEEAKEFIRKYYHQEYVEAVFNQKKNEIAPKVVPQNNMTVSNIDNTMVAVQPPQQQTLGRRSNCLRNYIAIHLSVLQQLAGINIVIIYGIGIINQAMNSSLNAKILQLFSVVVQGLGSLLSAVLLKRIGRKVLFQIGTAVSCLFMLLICIGFLALGNGTIGQQILIIVSLYIFMFDFGMTLGPVVFLYIPEIVDPPVIPYASMANWLACAATLIVFPIIGEYINIGYLFLFLSVWCLVSMFINHKYLVETANKTENQIREDYDAIVAKK